MTSATQTGSTGATIQPSPRRAGRTADSSLRSRRSTRSVGSRPLVRLVRPVMAVRAERTVAGLVASAAWASASSSMSDSIAPGAAAKSGTLGAAWAMARLARNSWWSPASQMRVFVRDDGAPLLVAESPGEPVAGHHQAGPAVEAVGQRAVVLEPDDFCRLDFRAGQQRERPVLAQGRRVRLPRPACRADPAACHDRREARADPGRPE